MAAIDIDKAVEIAIKLVREAHSEQRLQELTKGKVRQQVEEVLGYEAGVLGEKLYKKRISEAVETTVEEVKSQKNVSLISDKEDARKEENEKTVKPSSPGKKRKSVGADGSPAKKSKPKSSSGAGRDHKDGDANSKDRPSSTRKKQKEKETTKNGAPKKKRKQSTDQKIASQEKKGDVKSNDIVVSDDEDKDAPKDTAAQPTSPSSTVKKNKRAVVSDIENEAESSTSPKRRRKSGDGTSSLNTKLDYVATETASVDKAKEEEEGKADNTEPISDSELSGLVDDPPVKTKKEKKTGKKSKGEPEKKSRSKKETKELSPDEEQIKKLKSFVVACGVRKVWSKELKDCETPSSQIAHLRKLLSDLGMKGRFSLEQAKAIKAKRDLEREMADVQEFAERYAGDRPKRPAQKSLVIDASSGEDEDDDANPSRRRKNAHQSIMDFLGDQSESD